FTVKLVEARVGGRRWTVAPTEARKTLNMRSSCRPSLNGLHCAGNGFDRGPLGVPSMPSGKNGRARLPTDRLLYATPFASAVGSPRKVRIAVTYPAIDEVAGGVR